MVESPAFSSSIVFNGLRRRTGGGMVAMGEEWAVGQGISVLSEQRGIWDSGVWRQRRLNTRMEHRQWKVALDDAFTGRNNVIQVYIY